MRTRENTDRSVLVVAGPAGSGKSTLGRSLAAACGAVLLDQDIATNPLMAQLARLIGAGDDLDHPGLRGPVRRARYQCLIDIAVDNGRLGRTVVMVAPFTIESADRRHWAELVRQLSPAQVELIWVTVPSEVARERRRRRNLPRDRAAALDASPVAAADPVVPHLAASGSVAPDREALRLLALLGARSYAGPESSPTPG